MKEQIYEKGVNNYQQQVENELGVTLSTKQYMDRLENEEHII